MCNIMNGELKKLCLWLQINKLSLNIDKTKYMLFSKKDVSIGNVSVNISNVSIKNGSCVKFLGIHIDKHLSWSDHVRCIKNKSSKAIGIICKAKKVLMADTLLTLYNSFILPYFTYCIEVWGSSSNYNMNSLFVMQKKAIRIIASKPRLALTDPLFMELGLLNVSDLYTNAICVFMYKYYKQLLPEIFDDMFLKNRNVYHRATRQQSLLHVPISKSVILSRSIRVKGVTIWNTFAHNVDVDCSLVKYKYTVKRYLLFNNVLELFLSYLFK